MWISEFVGVLLDNGYSIRLSTCKDEGIDYLRVEIEEK